MRIMLKLSTLVLSCMFCLISSANAQQRKNFIITQCIVEKDISAFRTNFSEKEAFYVNETTDLFVGENIQVIKLEPAITSSKSNNLPNYKFNLLGFTFSLQYYPLNSKYKKFKSSEFYLSNMIWYNTETQHNKSEFKLRVKENHDELGPIIISLSAVLDTGS